MINQEKIDGLAKLALRFVKNEYGSYVCKCLFVNGVFLSLLEQNGIQCKLVSGKLAGGFNDSDSGSFRYGYTQSEQAHLIDHHVWCEGPNGEIFDAMMLVMDEEIKITSHGEIEEYLLPKTSVIANGTIKSYEQIMDDYQIGLCYEKVSGWDQETMGLVTPFLVKHSNAIQNLIH